MEGFIKDTFSEYERYRWCYSVNGDYKEKYPMLAKVFKANTEDLRALQNVLKMELLYREITGNDNPGIFRSEKYSPEG